MTPEDPNEPLPTTPAPEPYAGQPSTPPGQPLPPWGATPPPWPPPPWSYPAPQASPWRWGRIVGLVLAGVMALGFLLVMVAIASALSGESLDEGSGPPVGVIDVKGTIGLGQGVDSERIMRVIRRYRARKDMKAVVVRIDSPGGAVAPSQEIYDEIRKLAAQKTVVCSMGSVAASGGFYIAMACPTIYAEPGTITGSIGVITQFPNLKGIADRLSFRMETITSGKMKDSGNPFRDMQPEERDYWKRLVTEVSEQFIDAVAAARHLPKEQVQASADGRVFTGKRALELKLIDNLGSFQDAVAAAMSKAGLQGDPRLVYPPEPRSKLMEQLVGEAVHSAADSVRSELRQGPAEVSGPGIYYLAQ